MVGSDAKESKDSKAAANPYGYIRKPQPHIPPRVRSGNPIGPAKGGGGKGKGK